jgi:hypothetical protein
MRGRADLAKRMGPPVCGLKLGAVSQSSQPMSCCPAASISGSENVSSQARSICPDNQAWASWLIAIAPVDSSRNNIDKSYTAYVESRRRRAIGSDAMKRR